MGSHKIESISIGSSALQVSDRRIGSLVAWGGSLAVSTDSHVEELKIVTAEPILLQTGRNAQNLVVVHEPGRNNTTARRELNLVSGSSVHINSLVADSLTLSGSANLTVGEIVSKLTVVGPGILRIEKGAAGLRLEAPSAELHVEPYATLTGISGELRLERAAHASISGIRPYNPDRVLWLSRLTDRDDELHGVSINHFKVAVSLNGVRILNQLKNTARQATPLIHPELPGLRADLRLGRANVDRKVVRASTRLEYASSIAALSRVGDSPASVRTLLAWCAYRVSIRSG